MLFAEEDRHAFFLVGGVLDIGAPIAMSVICIRVGDVPTAALHSQAMGEQPAGGAQRQDRRRQGGNRGDKHQGSQRCRCVGADLLHCSGQAAGRDWVVKDGVPPHSD